jgi:molecular chaperone GrpE
MNRQTQTESAGQEQIPFPEPQAEPASAPELVEIVPLAALREAEAKRDEYLELAQRTRAELENFRKRVEREREELKRASLGGFLKNFFGPFDDLERAIREGEKQDSYEVIHAGVKMVRDNLWKVLESAGVKKIEALEQKFDPGVHEAMTALPSDKHEPNTVIEVFQNGYTLDGFVLQPARVVVSAPKN